MRVWAAQDHEHPLARIDASLPLLPADGAIGGWAAACLSGIKMLDGRAPAGVLLPVDHVVPPERRRKRRAGVVLHRERLVPDDVVHVGRVRVTAPVRTAVDMARWAASVSEAVVALDVLLHAGYTTLQRVTSRLAALRRLRGLPQARAAIDLVDARAESPWETRLRLLWMLDAGLPRPEANVELRGQGGRLLGRPDLLDLEAGLVLEYDGAHHRELAQHTRDNAREERFERAGLRVIRFTVLDLLDRRACVARMRTERALRLSRDRTGETWFVGAAQLGTRAG